MTGLEVSQKIVLSLVEDFQAHEEAYRAHSYNETELRNAFLDKFFTALGWDVGHVRQKNPFEQEVKVERGVKDKGAKRRADYAFYIAPNFRDPRFYAEAKRPGVDLATRDHYFQAIRYGWNSHTPLAVITNFYQLHLLDCRYKPDIDTALERRVKLYALEDLKEPEKFAELYYLLSREAVASGSLEKFSATLPKKRGKALQLGLFKGGYQRMDRTFLTELDGHREVLARSFNRTNPALDGNTLTEVTQRVLDRLIFIRFLEDKLIEPDYLVANFGFKGTAWGDFVTASRRLDAVYNGVVFKQHLLLDSAKFKVEDAVFSDVCEHLAHVNSPYDFNAVPIHILGSIYERFLGNVIVVTPKGAKLEEKPEVRKAGGVYYTPEYIVRYLSEQTVGRCIDGKSPQQMAGLRFCDIACGSGSFLLGVYELLLEQHRKWYRANPDRAKRDGCVLNEDGTYHLSLAQRRTILLNSIFGVDVDPQAVEVAQLSLYLKLLEEETTATARSYQLEFRETLLPPLKRNIICGNSVIETDILDGNLFDQDEERRLRPMDLKAQFPRVMADGGFDAVVGNPPYVRPHNLTETQKKYFWQHYPVFKAKADIYTCFIQRSTELIKPGGYLGYIVSQGWLALDSFDALRRFILDHHKVTQLVRLPERVFEDAQVETMAFVFQRETNKLARLRNRIDIRQCEKGAVEHEFRTVRTIPQKAFSDTYLNVFDLSIEPQTEAVKAKMRKGPLLGSMYDVVFGLKTADDSKFLHVTKGKHKEDKPLLRGDDVRRYRMEWKGEYVWYVPKRMRAHRTTARPGEAARFEQAKVLVKDTTKDLACTYEPGEYYVKDVLIVIPKQTVSGYDLRALTGMINSKALRFLYRTTFQTLHVQNKELASLPLPRFDLTKKEDKESHDQLVELVAQMLEAQERRAKVTTEADGAYLDGLIGSLDRRIDEVVYSAYGLDAADKMVVEESLEDGAAAIDLGRSTQSTRSELPVSTQID
jgi:type I restriction-modification system DNA methylase subunit